MANLQKMNTNLVQKDFFQEFSELFGYGVDFVDTAEIHKNLEKNIVDKSYLEALILVGEYHHWHRTSKLVFDDFSKQFYADFIKIFYFLHDPHFEISHFRSNYPQIVVHICKKFAAYRRLEIFCDENICVK